MPNQRPTQWSKTLPPGVFITTVPIRECAQAPFRGARSHMGIGASPIGLRYHSGRL